MGDLPQNQAEGPSGIEGLPTAQLFSTYRSILRELRKRGVIRTTNAPTGDYAEFLVARLMCVKLAQNSEKSWDLRAQDGKMLQVKSRGGSQPPSSRREAAFTLSVLWFR